jgi:hypothetical protein
VVAVVHAGVKSDTINLQILHYALDVVARFGKRNAFYPIDRIPSVPKIRFCNIYDEGRQGQVVR